MGVRWFLASRLGPRLLLVSAPVVAMPDDDQLSDLASVQILSHPHLAQIRSRSHQWPPRATVPEPLQAAGKLPCATTLSSLDAAVVTRRRRRVTSFAFPSGGAGASADSAEKAGCSVRPSSVIVKGTHAASLSRSHPAARALPT